jgi:hypothetical protein
MFDQISSASEQSSANPYSPQTPRVLRLLRPIEIAPHGQYRPHFHNPDDCQRNSQLVPYTKTIRSDFSQGDNQPPVAKSHLCSLPPELHIRITLELGLSDLLAFGQCCRSFNAITSDAYHRLYGSAVEHRLRGSSSWRSMVLELIHFGKCSRARVHQTNPTQAVDQLLDFRTPVADTKALSEMVITVHRETDGSCIDVLEALATACLVQGWEDEVGRFYSRFLTVQSSMSSLDWGDWVVKRRNQSLTGVSTKDSLPPRAWLAFTLFPPHSTPPIVSRSMPNMRTCTYSLPLEIMYAAASRGNVQTMKQLQDANDDELLDVMSYGEGKSLVDIAVENEKVVVLKYLCKEGYDILRPSAGHMHPLMLSIYCGQVSNMQYLVGEGAMLDLESFIRPITISCR